MTVEQLRACFVVHKEVKLRRPRKESDLTTNATVFRKNESHVKQRTLKTILRVQGRYTNKFMELYKPNLEFSKLSQKRDWN